MHEGGKKAVLAALLANGGIAVAKFVGFGITGASSMLAEAIHSCADTGNQALLLVGAAKGKQAPNERHPFGYGRERYFWAFVVAMVLFSVGSLFALFEGYEKLIHPHDLDHVQVAIGILLFAIVLETFSFRTAIVEARKMKAPGQGWWNFVQRTKQPEIAVVLLEDLAALVGLFLALGGVTLAYLTGDSTWDAIGTLAIGVLLGIVAMVLAKENKSLLIGEAADADELAEITNAIESADAARRTIHLRTLHLGPDDLLIAAKVEFDPSLDQPALAAAINAIEGRIREVSPTARLIFIEPDIYSADAAVPKTSGPAAGH